MVNRYQIIYADPPWKRDRYSQKGLTKSGDRYYPTMSDEELCLLPVSLIASKNAVLFMWVVDNHLEGALGIMNAWGFEYKTVAFNWFKLTSMGKPCFGLGHWTRKGSEICLLGKRGNIKRASCSIRQVIECPISVHSKKPPEIRDRIVGLMGDLPRIELFARQKAEGWDCWGNEVESDIEL